MARIRTIKPAFFTSEDICRCSRDARLLFIGLWTEADREGRLEDRPTQIKIRIFPSEDDLNVAMLLDELHAAGLIERYRVDSGKPHIGMVGVIQITGFVSHQRPHPKEPQSILPAAGNKAAVVEKREPLVYFIGDSAKNAIKIGVAYRPEHRLASLQTGSSTPLQLLGTCQGGFPIETELHQKLVAHRLHGEWFQDNEAIRTELQRLCRDQVFMVPECIPSSPVGREGDLESGVLGREGKGTGTRLGLTTRGAFEPGSLPRDHIRHGLCGAQMRLCLSEHVYGKFITRYGGDATEARRALQRFVDELEAAHESHGDFLWLEDHFTAFLRTSGRLKDADAQRRQDRPAPENDAHERELQAIKDGTYGR